MNLNITKKEKQKLILSRIAGAFLSGLLVALLVLYYLDRINMSVIILSILGIGALILSLSTLSFNLMYSKFWAGVLFALAVVFAIGFIVAFIYLYLNGIIVV